MAEHRRRSPKTERSAMNDDLLDLVDVAGYLGVGQVTRSSTLLLSRVLHERSSPDGRVSSRWSILATRPPSGAGSRHERLASPQMVGGAP
jgi:hypothetical protein